MGVLQPLFFLILALSILVVVHEWGHYFVARRAGVRVLQFSVGFGPELFGRTIGDTRWSLCAIPFGGYVKFAGEDPDEEGPGAPDEFQNQSLSARTAIVLAGPVMNYVLAIVLAAIVLYIAGDPVPPGTRIGDVVEDSVAEELGIQRGDVIQAVNSRSVATWPEFTENLHLIGEGSNFSLTVARDGRPLTIDGYTEDGFGVGSFLGVVTHREPVLGWVRQDGPAWLAGMRVGDRITALEGTPVDSWIQIDELVRDRPGEALAVTYSREGQTFDETVTPRTIEAQIDGELQSIGDLDIRPFVETTPIGLGAAIVGGWQETWNLTVQVLAIMPRIPVMVFEGLKSTLTGEEENDEGLGGPVRMAEMFGEAARWGFIAFLGTMAGISAQLALFNLLPIPVLDGGHLAFYAIEAITRRPPSLRARMILQQVGFILLMILILSVTATDIGRLLG